MPNPPYSMTSRIKTISLYVSLPVFVALLGFVTSMDVAGQTPKAIVECPCDFESIQMTQGCWTDEFTTDPSFNSFNDRCILENTNFHPDPFPDPEFSIFLEVIDGTAGPSARCIIISSGPLPWRTSTRAINRRRPHT